MDFAAPFRRALIASATGGALSAADHETVTRQRLASKRREAIDTLGDGWMLHPNYNPDLHAHHQPGHRESMLLRGVEAAALAGGRL